MKLNVHFEPPFNELTEELHKTVDFEKDITLEELLEHFYKKYGEKFKELIWDKNKKGVLSSPKKAFSAVTKTASAINKGKKVAKSGIKRKLGLAMRRILK